MKVLVTGANGLLGHHIVFELLRQKHKVSVIIRSKQNIYFDLNEVEVHIGNFTDYEQLSSASLGCDAIIHAAAITTHNLIHYEDYQKINTFGVGLVVRIANELNIEKIVFVSTANTVGFGEPDQLADETFPVCFPFSKSYYTQSKVEAERIFMDAAFEKGKHIVIINPTFMIGAFDTKPSSGKLILRAYRKRILVIPGGGKNFVPVTDVANVVCNSLSQGRSGERYLVSGENLSFAEFYTLQKRIGDYKQLIISIPDFFLETVGKAGDLIRKFGIKTEICSMNLQQLMIREYYTNTKAKKELGLKPTSLENAITDALDWFNNSQHQKGSHN
ncbi:MAG: NAD-dependent epimerase/dehydratase family protein [Paludibacter sp.]